MLGIIEISKESIAGQRELSSWQIQRTWRGGGFHHEQRKPLREFCLTFPLTLSTHKWRCPRAHAVWPQVQGRNGWRFPLSPQLGLTIPLLVFQLQGSPKPRNSNAPTVTSHLPKTLIFSNTSEGTGSLGGRAPAQRQLGATCMEVRPLPRLCAHLQACSAQEEGSSHSSQIQGLNPPTETERLACLFGWVPLN